MHDHKCECKHSLHYCEHCDVVYCSKCGREWGNKVVYRYYGTPYYYTNQPSWTIATDSTTQSFHTHTTNIGETSGK